MEIVNENACVRELKVEDIYYAYRIACTKPKLGGTRRLTEDELLDYLTASVVDTQVTLFGYFENDQLISWIGTRFGTLDGVATWSISLMFTCRFHNHFSWNYSELGALIKYAFQQAEKLGYYQYVYSIATKLERVYERQWAKNIWMPTGRYNTETLARIPSMTVPHAPWQQRLIGGCRPDDMSINKRVLKEEYRNGFINTCGPTVPETRQLDALVVPVGGILVTSFEGRPITE